MPWPRPRTLLLLFACALLAALLNVPLAVSGIFVNWDDYSTTLLSRIAVANELLDYGWCRRFSLMLSGINAAENGLDPKLDTLLFANLDPIKATLGYYFARDFALLTGLSTILVAHYRVAPTIALAAAALACEGFNVFNWYFFGDDYFGSAFLAGYYFFPLLVLPALLLREPPTSRRLRLIFALSVAVGALYSFSTTFALSVFTLPLALIWIAIIVRSKSMAWPIAGTLIGAGVVALPGILSFLLHEDAIRTSVRAAAELSSFWDGLRFLVHRAPKLTVLGGVLVAAAAAAAALTRRLQDFGLLCLLYLLAMLPDVLVKSVFAPSAAMYPLLLSVNYYSYVIAPIFLCAALAIGYGALPRREVFILSAALMVLAGQLAIAKVAAERERPGMRLSELLADPALESVARLSNDTRQRAAMLTPDTASLGYFHFRIPRPAAAYLYVQRIRASDGSASSMSHDYAVLWSNILRPKHASEHADPDVLSQAYLELDLRDYIKEGADGCYSQIKKVPLESINTDLLGLTATRFIVSYVDVDDPRLRPIRQRSPGPIVCRDRSFIGGFNVYELAAAAERVSLARSVEVLKDGPAVLARMRQSSGAKDRAAAFLARADVKQLRPKYLAGSAGTVAILEDTPDHLSASVRARAPTLLIVRDSFVPGARISVDGKPATFVRANYTYMAIPIAAGKSLVDVRY